MLCLICKEREGEVHLTQIIGEKMRKVDLCVKCAWEKGLDDPASFSLEDFLASLDAEKKEQ